MAKKKTFKLSKPDFNLTRFSFGRKKENKDKRKKTKHAANDMYDAYKRKFLDVIANFFEQEFGVAIEWVRELLSVRTKMRKLTFYFILLFAGFTVALFGIAKYLDCLCSSLNCGASYVLVGLAAVIIAMLYKRFF